MPGELVGLRPSRSRLPLTPCGNPWDGLHHRPVPEPPRLNHLLELLYARTRAESVREVAFGPNRATLAGEWRVEGEMRLAGPLARPLCCRGVRRKFGEVLFEFK